MIPMSDTEANDDSGDDLFDANAPAEEDAAGGEVAVLVGGTGDVEANYDDEVEIVRVEFQPQSPAVFESAGDQQVDAGADDFQTPKKRRRIRDKKVDDNDNKQEDDLNDSLDNSEACPICFESWTNSGDHRLSSLACGHLFGYSCILKWLTGPGKSCPQCNAVAKKKDIRVIYAKRLQTIDTAELDRLRGQLAVEKHLRLVAEKDAASYRIQAALVSEECSRVRMTLDALRESINSNEPAFLSSASKSALQKAASKGLMPKASGTSGYAHVTTIRLAEGACRVMMPCSYMSTLCIAQASPNPLFRGFGIRKVHLENHHMDRFLVLHSQPIRDLALHPDMQDGLLLSVSMDKTAKLVSLFTGQVVQSYSCPLPVWSCTWHRDNHFQFFAGLSNGQVLLFDTRNTSAPVSSLNLATSLTPVCALQYAPRCPTDSFRPGGLFVGQLDRVTFLAEAHGPHAAEDLPPPPSASSVPLLPTPVTPGFKTHPLPLEGSLVSLSFEATTRHLLATFRPSRCQAALANVRHLVCQMECRGVGQEATVSCHAMHTLTAGRCLQRMTRARLFQGPGDRLTAASGDEESGCTLVWDAAQAQRVQQLQGSGSTVLDVAPFEVPGGTRGLVSLSESAVQFFRWNEES